MSERRRWTHAEVAALPLQRAVTLRDEVRADLRRAAPEQKQGVHHLLNMLDLRIGELRSADATAQRVADAKSFLYGAPDPDLARRVSDAKAFLRR